MIFTAGPEAPNETFSLFIRAYSPDNAFLGGTLQPPAGGERAIVQLVKTTHAGMTTEKFE